MKINEYQERAKRTMRTDLDFRDNLINAALGLAGEAGEVADMVKKKEFQGRDVDLGELLLEVGDVLWYCALMAETIGVSLDYIAELNIDKLRKRYPGGW